MNVLINISSGLKMKRVRYTTIPIIKAEKRRKEILPPIPAFTIRLPTIKEIRGKYQPALLSPLRRRT